MSHSLANPAVSLDNYDDDESPPDLEDASDVIRLSRATTSSSSSSSSSSATGSVLSRDKSTLVFLDSPVGAQEKKTLVPGQSLAIAALPDSMRSQLREEEERRKAAEEKAIASVASPSKANEESALGLEMIEAGRAAAADAERERRSKEIASSKNFGAGTAIKKGFLLGGSSEKSKPRNVSSSSSLVAHTSSAPKDDDIVRPKGGATPAGFLPEVQDALQAQGGPSAMQAKLDKERGKWMTPELIDRVKREPKLLAGMQNPRFMQALSELGTDPKAAFEKYKKDEGVQDFLRTFMGLMGSHFEEVAATEDIQKQYDGGGESSTGKSSTSSKTAVSGNPVGLTPISSRALSSPDSVSSKTASSSTAVDSSNSSILDNPQISSDEIAKAAKDGQIGAGDADARRVLSNKELVDLLRDPLMKRVLEECKEDGRNLMKWLQVPQVRAKLRIMEKHGLIRLEGM